MDLLQLQRSGQLGHLATAAGTLNNAVVYGLALAQQRTNLGVHAVTG